MDLRLLQYRARFYKQPLLDNKKKGAYDVFYVLVLKIQICNFCGYILQLHLLRLKTRELGLEILNVGGIKCKNVYEMGANVDTDLWKAISILGFLKPTP